MRGLSRRQFGAFSGATLSLLALPRRSLSHNGPHLHKVEIKSFNFAPDALTIRAGDTVEWTNSDAAPHTATDRGGAWDTGQLSRGESAALTFDVPGRFECYCAYHPAMLAEIIVE